MKVLKLDYCYYEYPNGIASLEDFIAYANEHYHSFIKLTRFEIENCVFPYLVCEDTKETYVNMASIEQVCEENATILCRADYDARLEQVVKKKCINCIHYEEEFSESSLNGHREKLSLDGECWEYEKSSDTQ